MMREILFRGKRIDNGEWVEGFYHFAKWYLNGNFTGKITYYIRPIGAQDAYQVEPETVGQYTGLTDKNGNRIFEGDIVRKPELYMNAVGVIRYGGTHFRCSCKEYPDLGIWTLDEVIGNIHDNPELLEVSGDD